MKDASVHTHVTTMVEGGRHLFPRSGGGASTGRTPWIAAQQGSAVSAAAGATETAGMAHPLDSVKEVFDRLENQ